MDKLSLVWKGSSDILHQGVDFSSIVTTPYKLLLMNSQTKAALV